MTVDTESVWFIGISAVALVAFLLGVSHVWIAETFSVTHKFEASTGDAFWWVPQETDFWRLVTRHFIGKHFEHGLFEYEDGTPVTDPGLHRLLQDEWIEWAHTHFYCLYRGN